MYALTLKIYEEQFTTLCTALQKNMIQRDDDFVSFNKSFFQYLLFEEQNVLVLEHIALMLRERED